MKRLQAPLWFSMLLLSTAVLANAQNRPPANGSLGPGAANEQQRGPGASSCRPPGPPMEELTATLGLQANQRDALSTLLKERHEAMRKVREQGEQNAQAVASQSNAKIAKLLSPEQMGKFQQWESTHRPPPPPGMDSKRGEMPQAGMQRRGPGQGPRAKGQAGQQGPQAHDRRSGNDDCQPPPPRDGNQAGGRP